MSESSDGVPRLLLFYKILAERAQGLVAATRKPSDVQKKLSSKFLMVQRVNGRRPFAVCCQV